MYKVAFKANVTYQLIGWYCSVRVGTAAVAADKNMRKACYKQQYNFGSDSGVSVATHVTSAASMHPKSTASMILATVMSL